MIAERHDDPPARRPGLGGERHEEIDDRERRGSFVDDVPRDDQDLRAPAPGDGRRGRDEAGAGQQAKGRVGITVRVAERVDLLGPGQRHDGRVGRPVALEARARVGAGGGPSTPASAARGGGQRRREPQDVDRRASRHACVAQVVRRRSARRSTDLASDRASDSPDYTASVNPATDDDGCGLGERSPGVDAAAQAASRVNGAGVIEPAARASRRATTRRKAAKQSGSSAVPTVSAMISSVFGTGMAPR